LEASGKDVFEAWRLCGKMNCMRDLSDDYKISVRGIEEVDEALGTLVARLKADRKIRYKRHTAKPAKPGKAALVNALILWLNNQPVGEQKRIAMEGLASLDALLAMESPGGGSAQHGPEEEKGISIEKKDEETKGGKNRSRGNAS
jgi:hypothetical protein